MTAEKRRVLILGGNSGLGCLVAEKLMLHSEIELTVTFRTFPIDSYLNSEVMIEICDTNKYLDVERLLTKESNSSKWDLIVDFTGQFFAKSLIKATEHEISRTITTNLISPAWLVKLALRGLNQKGQLILFSSVVGSSGGFGSSAYSASKMGIEALVKAASCEYAPRELSVSCIRLSYFDAGMTQKLRLSNRNSPDRDFWKDIEIKSPEILSTLILKYALGVKKTLNGQVLEL